MFLNIVNPQSIEIIILLSLWHNGQKRKIVGKINNYKQAVESFAIIPRGYTRNLKLIATENLSESNLERTFLAQHLWPFIPCYDAKVKEILTRV